MVAGRWVLLALMVLVGPLLWWAGVVDTSSAAYAVAPGDADGRDFISNYDGPGRGIACFFAFINLVFLAVFMPTARQLRTGGIGRFVRVIITSVLAFGLAWFEYVFNPVSSNWGGDPDGWSMVEHHIAPWYDRFGVIWIVALTATIATIVVLAIAAIVSAARERRF
jgi:hypothetical protein